MTEMKLKYPESEVDFDVSPAYFIGGFDVYDREETLEVHLNTFDPNNEDEFKKIFEECFFNTRKIDALTVDHKVELVRVLKSALDKSDYDFNKILLDDHDECFYIPSEWNIVDPRCFFENIYSLINKRWK